MDQRPSEAPFGHRPRRIRPFDLPEHPGDGAGHDALDAFATQKAASLNSHVIGHGALAEGEWQTPGRAG